MYKVAVIGDRDSVLGFAAVGISVFPVMNSEEALLTLRRIEKEGYAVIYLTEQIAVNILAEIEEYKDNEIPIIVLIPGNQGSIGIGLEAIKRSAERAIGVDILFNEED